MNKGGPSISSSIEALGESTLSRVAKYTVAKAAMLFVMVAIGVFLAVLVLNYGGYIDKIYEADIDEALNYISLGSPGMSNEELIQATEQARWAMEEAYGLHEPFLLRCLRWSYNSLMFNWGSTHISFGNFPGASQAARKVILAKLPNSLLLIGAASLLVFFTSVFTALFLTGKYNSLLDKILIALSPISSVPNWVYGIILTVIFAANLHLLPFNGMLDDFPPATKLGYVPIVLKHMILPVSAIFLSLFFQSTYAWRTFFLIHSGEDYVEVAKAKGLPARSIERNYILRPVLPYVLTNFALTLIGFWQGIMVLELFFKWPGIGSLFLTAVRANDRAISAALIVLFAYMLALTILLLDIFYALVDPRVRVAGGEQTVRLAVIKKRGLHFWRFFDKASPPPLDWRSRLAHLDTQSRKTKRKFSSQLMALKISRRIATLKSTFREIGRYPSAIVGLLIIAILIGVSIYTIIALPYDKAVDLWRPVRLENYSIPLNARPEWVNFFKKDKLPPTLIMDTRNGTAGKVVQPGSNGGKKITILFPIIYRYGSSPQDLAIYFHVSYNQKKPFVSLTWYAPDGRKLDLGGFSVVGNQTYIASQLISNDPTGSPNSRQQQWLRGQEGKPPVQILFADSTTQSPIVLKGFYILRIDGFTFEESSDLDAELVLYGQVYGLAGTDNHRRDLSVALLWGAPVALAFGLFGAIITTFLSMTIAAFGAWHGGWVDSLIQRVTEVNMILPSLPIGIMVYYLYSKSVWAILGVIVVLSIFGSSIKNYRAIFLQVKETPYIEAARAYGASSGRIILHYMVPRILPVLVPQLVILIPTFLFFEATLAFLNVTDPYLPTWGKVIYDALTQGAFQGYNYWVLEPTSLMIMTGVAFAMLGLALDRIFNPRLRDI
jgi:peptide/nickel transport system permease protein